MQHGQPHWVGLLVGVGIAAVVLAVRLRRAQCETRLRLERIWIIPLVYTLLVALIFLTHPPHGLIWLYVGIGLLIGAAGGWYRGKLMHIRVDPETHELSQRASPAAMFFILALVALRFVMRGLMNSADLQGPAMVLAATDILLAFTLGFLVAQRMEMALRARVLLNQARGGVR